MKTKLKIILTLTAGAAILIIGSRMGYHRFAVWRQGRLIRQARQYFEQNQPRQSLLCLENALKHNPNDPEACRLMAALTEAARLPTALAWRNRALEINPHSLDDRLALAQTALMFGEPDLAANVLAKADPGSQRTAKYFNTAGAVAMARNEPAQAAANFLEASRLEPTNDVPAFNLSLLHLRATDAATLDQARTDLAHMSTNGTGSQLRTLALRELARDALHHQQSSLALERVGRLLHESNSVWADRLLRVEAEKQAGDSAFQSNLSTLEHEASLSSTTIYQCAKWEMENLSAADALKWLRSLPPGVQTNQPAAVLIAECLALSRDWRGLHDSLATERWGEWDFVRHAFMARALRGQELSVTATTEWAVALKAAANRQVHLHILFRLASQWNWVPERESILWSLVDSHPEERWALDELSHCLFQEGQTRSLLKLWNQERTRSPANLSVANNLALTALLLDAKEFSPHALAQEVYQHASTNANYASTYAFSLYLQGKYTDALAVMNQLPPETLQNPTIAGYYGLLLKAAGQSSTAQLYLKKSSTASLLPEERRIFNQAMVGNGS